MKVPLGRWVEARVSVCAPPRELPEGWDIPKCYSLGTVTLDLAFPLPQTGDPVPWGLSPHSGSFCEEGGGGGNAWSWPDGLNIQLLASHLSQVFTSMSILYCLAEAIPATRKTKRGQRQNCSLNLSPP